MNSRERIYKTINHEIPDRVPIDLGGNQSSIHIIAYFKLLDYLKIEDKHPKLADFGQQIALPCEELLQRFHIDVRYIRPNGAIVDYPCRDVEYEGKYMGKYDQFGVFWGNYSNKDLEDILYYDPVIHPLSEMNSVNQIKNYNWPDGKDKTPFIGLKEKAKRLKENTNFAISTSTMGNTFEYTTFLFGFTKALRHVRKNPELIQAAMEELLKYWMDYNTTFLEEVGEYLDIICVNGDLAEQSGPIINPIFYDEYVKPLDKTLADLIYKKANVKINYHCCGSTPLFIPSWIDVGFKIYNPVQISAFDMEPCSLKKRFGDKIVFWGGLCDTQNTLPFKNEEQINQEVKRNLNCFKNNGGYVAANIHNITSEVPPQNITAMFDAAYQYGKY